MNQGSGPFLVREAVWSPVRLGVLVGPLFSCSCGWRIFLWQLFSLLAKVEGRHHFVHFNAVAKADLAWWDCFLQDWHGAAFVIPGDAPSVHVHSDAAENFGCGAVTSSDRWLQVQWPDSWSEVSIAAKEMAPVVMAAATWGQTWHRCNVFFHCDNAAVVAVIQRKSMRDALFLHLLRCLYFYAAFFQFLYSAHHLPWVSNVAADAFSRGNMSLFVSLFPQGVPSTVSWEVMQLLAGLGISGLDKAVQGYLMTSLSTSTLRSYRTAVNSYTAFCHSFGFTFPFPTSEPLLTQFAAFLAERNLSYGSIRVYLSGICFTQITLGFCDPAFSSLPQLEYVLRVIRRASPGHVRSQRLPVTPLILRLLFSMWSQQPMSQDAVMLWAACCTGFFGFLRAGGFTGSAQEKPSLTVNDISVDSHSLPSFVSLHLCHSKTDTFVIGVLIFLGHVDGPICPIKLLLSYLAVRGSASGHLFQFQDGSPCLVRSWWRLFAMHWRCRGWTSVSSTAIASRLAQPLLLLPVA